MADLARTARSKLNFNKHAIPSFALIFAKPIRAESNKDGEEHGNQRSLGILTCRFALGTYILDFYTHS